MIPFRNRFHGHSSLNYVYKNGQKDHSRYFTIKLIKNKNRKDTRAAVVISKKVLKSAVYRNKVRRHIYEYVQTIFPKLNNIYDIVIIVSSGEVLSMKHSDIVDNLNQSFSHFDIFK